MITLKLDGQRFGKLLVLGELPRRTRPSGQRARYFLCRCDCGNSGAYCLGQLRSGHTSSCGCSRTERTVKRNTTHGLSKQFRAEYLTWKGMRQRCSAQAGPDYERYARRGIEVCSRWHDFANFLADMGKKPSPQHSLDRWPDRDGNYGPDNCRWATPTEQSRNRDIVRTIQVDGEEMPLTEASLRTGIKVATLRARLRAGWDCDRAISTPVGAR